MPNEDELSDSGMKVAGYGFNIRVEGEDISEITFINKNGFFLKKIDYYYREVLPEYEEEMKEFFAQYPYGYGIALKESAYKDLTPENTGADDTIMWYFVDAGNRYTVAYDQQGTADNLYALGFTAPRRCSSAGRISRSSDAEHSTGKKRRYSGNTGTGSQTCLSRLSGACVRRGIRRI